MKKKKSRRRDIKERDTEGKESDVDEKKTEIKIKITIQTVELDSKVERFKRWRH